MGFDFLQNSIAELYPEAATASTASICETRVAFASEKGSCAWHAGTPAFTQDFCGTPFTRPHLFEEDSHRNQKQHRIMADLFPWRCIHCQRINKKVAEQCALCKAHWTTGMRHNTAPNAHKATAYRDAWPPKEQHYAWEDWENWDNWQQRPSRSQSRTKSPRATKGSQSPRGRKGKGKGIGKHNTKHKDAAAGTPGAETQGMNYSSSPFAPLAASLPPWPSLEGLSQNLMPATPSAASSSNNLEVLAQKRECVAALKVAYPDISVAPQETQELIEKMDKDIERLEKENSKFVTKNLHAATKTLGKAQKTLTEALESRKVHRTRWIKHITEAVTTWQTQLQEYQKQQGVFQTAATKARADIETARREIQELSVKASQATLAAMPPITAVTAEQDEGNMEADTEEEKLQGQLQSVLQHCAAVLKAEAPQQVVEAEDLTMEDDERDKKRQRSMEPFGVPASAGAPLAAKNA